MNDVQHYYDYKNDIYVNEYGSFLNQHQFRKKEEQLRFTDITLRVYFALNKEYIDVRANRFILAVVSDYFKSMLTLLPQQQGDGTIVNIHTDYDREEHGSVIQEFFTLFHVSLFDDTQFNIEQLEFIVSNVFVLCEMASYFQFRALEMYCQHKMVQHFDVVQFGAFFNFCLIENVHNGLYSVVHERKYLFKRLVSWFVCCAEIRDYMLPYTSLMMDTSNRNLQNKITTMPSRRSIKPSVVPVSEGHRKRKRHQLRTVNDKKVEIYEHMHAFIENFLDYDCYSSFVKEHDSMTTQLRSFTRLCVSCVTHKTSINMTCMNQVMPQHNTRRKWYFYADLNIDRTKCSTLYARIEDSHVSTSPDVMNLDQNTSFISCDTEVTTLSKLYENKATKNILPVISNFKQFVALCQFKLHENDQCYYGECDSCRARHTPLYIIKFDLNATIM